MPNCIQLIDKHANRPEALSTVDEKMRLHFNAPQHPTEWFCSWYNIIGFSLAMGKTFAEIIEQSADYPMTQKIAQWLDENYTANTWE